MMDYAQRLLPRFRFGIINPHSRGGVHRGTTYQFYRIVPTDVMEIATVLGLEDYTPDKVETAIDNYWKCVDRLAREKVDCIVLGGVPISAQLGRVRVLDLLRQTRERTGIRGDAPLEALIAAMNHLGLTKLVVGSRWATELNQAIVHYLQAAGVDVVGITGRGQWAGDAAAMSFEQGLQTALDVGREAAQLAPNGQAIFVPGGAAMALHVIPALEEEFRKPAFTNLSVEVWNNLVRPGVIPPVEGWGHLLGGHR